MNNIGNITKRAFFAHIEAAHCDKLLTGSCCRPSDDIMHLFESDDSSGRSELYSRPCCEMFPWS